jgi:acetyl esterase/lipase
LALLLMAAVGLPALLHQVSVQPGAALVKTVFELEPLVRVPTDYASQTADVRAERDIVIPVPGAPAAGLDVYYLDPADRPDKAGAPIILWVHGGGYVSGSKSQVAQYAMLLASEGYVVASLDYSLAPGSRHPVPVLQGNAALGHLVEHADAWGGDAGRFFLGGDSAGAQIASEISAAQINTDLAGKLGVDPAVQAEDLRGVVLFCGLYDMRTVGATGFPALRTFLWSYTGYRDWIEYPGIDQLSTTEQVTEDYPATFLAVGDDDPFHSQSVALDRTLRTHGVPVTGQFWEGSGAHLGHEYQFDLTTSEAQQTYAQTLAFLAAQAGR